MHIVPENFDVNILDNGRTVRDFIDSKIEDLASKVSIRDIRTLKCSSLLIGSSVKSIDSWLSLMFRIKC